MYPVLLSIGPLHLYSLSVLLVLSWCVFSFLLWKSLRSQGVEDDRIFDLTFYTTLAALVGARAWFVAMNFSLFADNLLKVAAIWVQPGLSFYGGLVAGMLMLVLLVRSAKVRLGYALDAISLAIPAALIPGALGTFLDGSTIGKVANVPWAMRYIGHTGRRHPVQLYEFFIFVVLVVVVILLSRLSVRRKWPYGGLGVAFFLLLTPAMFILEFFREGGVYFKSVSANQWILVALFCEAVGAFYVRGGGREALRPLWYKLRGRITTIGGTIHDKVSRRH